MGDSLRYQDCFEKRHMTCAVRKSYTECDGGNDLVVRQTMEKMRKCKVQLYSDRKVIQAAPKCHSCLSISPVCKRKHTR